MLGTPTPRAGPHRPTVPLPAQQVATIYSARASSIIFHLHLQQKSGALPVGLSSRRPRPRHLPTAPGRQTRLRRVRPTLPHSRLLQLPLLRQTPRDSFPKWHGPRPRSHLPSHQGYLRVRGTAQPQRSRPGCLVQMHRHPRVRGHRAAAYSVSVMLRTTGPVAV